MPEESGGGSPPAGAARWTARGASAVLDQGLFAGGNFLLSLALARWLTPGEYGAYALAWSVFLLLAAFHTALVTEPMLVFGAGRFMAVFPRYLGILISGSTMVALVPAVLLAVTGWILRLEGEVILAQTFYALAIMSPCVLLLWLVRRAFYALMKPIWAAVGGGIYLAVILSGTVTLNYTGNLFPATALVAMAAASLASSAVLIAVLRPTLRHADPSNQAVARQHWKYGRWSSATTFLIWLPGNIYYVLLPSVSGLGGSASLKAVLNLLMPAFHVTAAIAILLVPVFVRTLRERGVNAFRVQVGRTVGLLVLSSVVFGVLLVLLEGPIFELLYEGKYSDNAGLLLYAVPLPALAAMVAVLGGALRALERPDLVFRCYVLSSLVVVCVGLPLVLFYGVMGSLFGLLASSVSTVLAMSYFWGQSQRPIGAPA